MKPSSLSCKVRAALRKLREPLLVAGLEDSSRGLSAFEEF